MSPPLQIHLLRSARHNVKPRTITAACYQTGLPVQRIPIASISNATTSIPVHQLTATPSVETTEALYGVGFTGSGHKLEIPPPYNNHQDPNRKPDPRTLKLGKSKHSNSPQLSPATTQPRTANKNTQQTPKRTIKLTTIHSSPNPPNPHANPPPVPTSPGNPLPTNNPPPLPLNPSPSPPSLGTSSLLGRPLDLPHSLGSRPPRRKRQA